MSASLQVARHRLAPCSPLLAAAAIALSADASHGLGWMLHAVDASRR